MHNKRKILQIDGAKKKKKMNLWENIGYLNMEFSSKNELTILINAQVLN